MGSFSKPSWTRCRDVVFVATEPPQNKPNCGVKMGSFSETNPFANTICNSVTTYPSAGCAQKSTFSIWVCFVKTMFCKPSLFHKASFKGTTPSLAFVLSSRLVRHSSKSDGGSVLTKAEALAAANRPFSKNCTDHTHLPARCPAKNINLRYLPLIPGEVFFLLGGRNHNK